MNKISDQIREKILKTADELALEGNTEPTNAQVLERMGKGSLSHVSPVMREWRQNRKKEQELETEVPEEIDNVLRVVGARVWKVASELAGGELKAFKLRADAERKECEQERDEVLKEVRKLEERVKEFEEEVSKHTELEMRLSELSAKCDTLTAEKTLLTDSLTRERENNYQLQQQILEIARGSHAKKEERQ